MGDIVARQLLTVINNDVTQASKQVGEWLMKEANKQVGRSMSIGLIVPSCMFAQICVSFAWLDVESGIGCHAYLPPKGEQFSVLLLCPPRKFSLPLQWLYQNYNFIGKGIL